MGIESKNPNEKIGKDLDKSTENVDNINKGGFNEATGEFENTDSGFHAEDAKNLKIMFTKSGDKIILLENGIFFDPAKGEYRPDIKLEDLHEDDH